MRKHKGLAILVAVSVSVTALLVIDRATTGCALPIACTASTERPIAYLYGDSLGAQVNEGYLPGLSHAYRLSVRAVPGIAPCDWLNAGITRRLGTVRPAVVILETAGINARTPCMRVAGRFPAVGTGAFTSRYERALHSLVDQVRGASPSVRIIYVGGPPMQDAAQNAEGTTLLSYMKEMARTVRQLRVSEVPRNAVADASGRFALRLTCDIDEGEEMGCAGGTIQVRAFDGVHFYCPTWNPYACGGYMAGADRFGTAIDAVVQKVG